MDISDRSSVFRANEPIRCGVPFPAGVLEDAAELRVWSARDGAALPVQARPLSRWPDGSLRWVLLDTRLDINKKSTERVAIGRADDIPAGDDPFTLHTEGDVVSLDSGDRSWDVLAPLEQGHSVAGLVADLVDRFGTQYRLEVDPDYLELIESGPLRATLKLRGGHRQVGSETGLPDPFHTVTIWMHVHADLGLAELEWSLENTPLKNPPGRLAFSSYSLSAAPPEGLTQVELAGRRFGAEEAVVQLQTQGKTLLTAGDAKQPSGPETDLWMGLLGEGESLHAHRVESRQNHPASMAWTPEEGMTIGLLPAIEGVDHYLDDATRKTFRFELLHDAGAAGAARMRRLIEPAYAALLPSEVAASGAWGDTGHVYLPTGKLKTSGGSSSHKIPTGWADWGEAKAKNTHQSGSPRNRLSVFLEAMQSGSPDRFSWSRSRAWHAMDLRPYHIEGFNADVYPHANLYEGTPHGNERPSLRLGRSEMYRRFPEWKQGLPSRGHGYNGFDFEHMAIDDVYECYLLTGSWPALSALRSAGEAMLTWKELVPKGHIHSSRTFGWTLRALMQVWRATGDSRYLDAARRYVARADAGRGKGEVKYIRPQLPDARHIADKYSDSPWMMAPALHGLAAYWQETEDPLVPPMLVDLTAFCMSAFRGVGFLPDMPADGSPMPDEVPQTMGVGSWVPGGLAAAAFVLDDHTYVDATIGYYAKLHAHTSQPVRFGAKDWHWWQTWMVSVEQRLGRKVVESPASYAAPRR
ncbi:MAG: hypothetical protein DRQ55_15090 [Planctomycetota bacterium]|nr:MAG: hypothetical protein DRQ55_15090 [Planctomycetota bacterium]